MKCGERQNACVECGAPFMAMSHLAIRCDPCRKDAIRLTNLRHRENNRGKVRSRQRFGKRVARGLIERPDRCSSCGAECKPQGHHADYSKPLEVTWLCRACHLAEHLSQPALPSPELPRFNQRELRPALAEKPVRVPPLAQLRPKWLGKYVRFCFIAILDRPWSEVS
jgi:hypothetical protein